MGTPLRFEHYGAGALEIARRINVEERVEICGSGFGNDEMSEEASHRRPRHNVEGLNCSAKRRDAVGGA